MGRRQLPSPAAEAGNGSLESLWISFLLHQSSLDFCVPARAASQRGGNGYLCPSAHPSGLFLCAAVISCLLKWVFLANLGEIKAVGKSLLRPLWYCLLWCLRSFRGKTGSWFAGGKMPPQFSGATLFHEAEVMTWVGVECSAGFKGQSEDESQLTGGPSIQ